MCKKFRYLIVLKRFIIIWILLVGVLEMRAQYDPSFSHYFDLEPSFNPAAVGKQSKLNVTAAYALDMAGFEHNPRTFQVAADMPFFLLNHRHGVGLSLLNDQIGLFTHQRLALQYALQNKLLGGTLSVGVQGGMLSEKFDGSKVDLGESGDPAFSTSDVNGSGMDLSLGLYYQHKAWYVGLSAQHLTSPTINLGETNELKIDATYYLTGGYNIRLRNPFLSIKPSLLVRTDTKVYRADISGRLVYKTDEKLMYAGLGYSPSTSVTFMVGGSFHGFVLGYSYEVYTSAISAANGSHELFLGYQHDINLIKKGKNKHKSVRIL